MNVPFLFYEFSIAVIALVLCIGRHWLGTLVAVLFTFLLCYCEAVRGSVAGVVISFVGMTISMLLPWYTPEAAASGRVDRDAEDKP